MRVQPGAELSVRNRQWLTIDNVFGDLTQRQRHRGEDEEAGDQRQTEKTFRVVVIFHRIAVGQTFLSVPLFQ